jgi:PAS domain S-box-containing protein
MKALDELRQREENPENKSLTTLQDALIASEARYRRLFETAKDGILILNAGTGKIDDVNPFLIDLLGYSKEDFIEKAIWEIGFFKDIIANQDKFIELQQKEYVRYEDLPLQTATGQQINVEFVSNVYSVNGHKVIQCNIRNITEHRQAEEVLRVSEASLQYAQEIAKMGNWEYDFIKQKSKWSKNCYKIFGLEPFVLTPTLEYFKSRIHPDDVHLIDEGVEKLIASKAPTNFEMRIIFPDGTFKWLLNNIIPFFTKGKLCKLKGTNIDITERKLAEATLIANSLRLELALTSGNMAWWEMDAITGAVTFEKAKAEMLGYAPDKFKHYMDFVNLVHPDDIKRIMMAMQMHLDGLVDKYEAEYRILTKSGEYCWFYDIGSVVKKDMASKPLLINGIVLNINKRKLAETELRNKEIRLHTLLQTIPDLIWLKDTEGVYLSCNTMFENFFGATESEIIGKTDYDFVSNELADFFREHDRTAMAAGKPTSNEEWVTFATGGQRMFLDTIKMPMFDSTGTLIGVLGVGRDITRRKQTEIKLLESEEKFKSIFEGSNDAIMLLNKDGIFDCNKRTLEIFKIDRKEELFGLHPLRFSPSKQANDRFSDEIADEIINEAHLPDKQIDWIFTRSNGEIFPAIIHFSSFTSRGENVQQVAIRDITAIEQKLIITNNELAFLNREKENRAAELIVANKRLAFENEEKENRAAELIVANEVLLFENQEKENRAAELIIANQELAFQNLEKENRAAELIVANKRLAFENEEKEKRAAELIVANKRLAFENEEKENRAAELIVANKELAFQNEEKEKRAAELIVANKRLAFENEEKEKRAAELIIANNALLFENQEKENRAAELIIANQELAFQNLEKENRAAELIVANKALVFENQEKEHRAAELIVAKEKAEESDHLKSAFLATMNHELRTPLNHILGFSEIINSMAENAEIKEWAHIIFKSGTGLLNMIEDIFDLALAEQGQIKIRKQSFKGIDIFLENRKSLDEIINNTGKESQINLVYKPDSKLLQTYLIADRSKINQVLINLFKNAAKFTNKGTIEFGFYQKDMNEIVFYVKDTGVGIQAGKLDVIFEFFRQLDDSNTRYYGGVGIGLAISKRIAEAMNARIVVESEVGKGTTFFLHIPVEIAPLGLPIHESDDDVTIPDLTGKTILIAEDDHISMRLVKKLLEATHANLVEAENGQEAIEKMVEYQNIDLILMDLKMPVLDGYKATTQIKAIWPNLVIIALTAYSIVKEKQIAFAAGCNDIIVKPIDKRILYAKLKLFCNS